jgi:hypothetical protein
MAKLLDLLKPSGRGVGQMTGKGSGHYYPLGADLAHFRDDFGTSVDEDHWVSSAGAASSASVAIQATAGAVEFLMSTETAASDFTMYFRGKDYYAPPLRATFVFQATDIDTAETFAFRLRDSSGTYVAEMVITPTHETAYSTATIQIRDGGTAVGQISSAGTVTMSGATGTSSMTAPIAYMLDLNPKGFFVYGAGAGGGDAYVNSTAMTTPTGYTLIQAIRDRVPSMNQTYAAEVQVTGSGAGGTLTGTLRVNTIMVEQYGMKMQTNYVSSVYADATTTLDATDIQSPVPPNNPSWV